MRFKDGLFGRLLGTWFCISAVMALCATSAAHGQCASAPFTVQVTTTGTSINTCTLNPLTNHWDLTVTINGPVSSNSNVYIRGSNTLQLGRVKIQNNSALDSRVYILGSGFDQRIGGVGFVDKGTSGANLVLILGLSTTGNVGYDKPGNDAIRVDSIYNLSIGGSVLGRLNSEAHGRSMGNCFIQGDLTGGIYLGPVSSLDRMWIGGNLGMPDQPPVRVDVSGNITSLVAGAINADISTWINNAAGTVAVLETTSGAFRGSLTAHRLAEFSDGVMPGRVSIAGDLDASVTLTRDIRVPFHVGGSFRQARLVAGIPIANVITTLTGQFDDPAAFPTSTFTVLGDFAGEMTLGVPNAAGLASINRDVIIGGNLTGAIATAVDIGANVSVGGAISGRITVGGGLRAGKTISSAAPMSGVVSIGGGLMGAISVPAGGLQGQVIVNAANSGGAWSGPVMVGGSSLFAPVPYYTTSSTGFGGGAVGVAPFKAHLEDCTPAHDRSTPEGIALIPALAQAGNNAVVFRTYGPMQPPSGRSPKQAVAIEQLVGGSWVDRSAFFTAAFVAGGDSGRALALSTGAPGDPLPPAGQYRLRNVSMQSAGVAGSPAVVWSTPFLFKLDTDCNGNGQADGPEIAADPSRDANVDGIIDSCQNPPPACPCDFNRADGLTLQDVFDYLRAYFQGSPLADFNLSGGISVQDILDFLACYFSRPAGC